MLIKLLIFLILTLSPMTIVDFNTSDSLTNWYIVNDTVMGGRSDSNFGLSDAGHGLFSGSVSLENNGGFASVRYNHRLESLSNTDRFLLRVKGDGSNYQFRVKESRRDYYSFAHEFKTTGEWQTIEIPFGELEPIYRGRDLNRAPFAGKQLEEIGFLIGNKTEQTFALEIDWIKLQ